jgi:PqqD family protein of HPr-rel-A system
LSPEVAEPRYVARSEDLALNALGSDWVLYHRPSAQTHFLNNAAAALLLWLAEEPLTAAELRGRLGDEAGADAPPLEPLLSRLHVLGLVNEHTGPL